MVVEYYLKSGAKVCYRAFESRDLRPCLGMIFANYKPPQDSWGYGLWQNEMKAFRPVEFISTARGRDYHVAESEGRVIGMAGIERFPPSAWRVEEAKRKGEPVDPASLQSPPAAVILDLAVMPEFQCRHVGRLLLLATMLRKIEQGVEHFYAYAPSHALPLFCRAGFTAASEPISSVMWGAAYPVLARAPPEKKGELRRALQAIQAQHSFEPAASA